MDESPAMKEHWHCMMNLRDSKATVVTAAPFGRNKPRLHPNKRNEMNVDMIRFMQSGRLAMASALTFIVREISRAHPFHKHFKFVEDLFVDVGRRLQPIRGSPILASASTMALAALPTSPSFWSHSSSEERLSRESWTENRNFDAFLDGRDVHSPRRARPGWVKDPAEWTLALAEEVAENAVEGWSGFIRPVDQMWQISSSFGPRWGRHHNGVDLAAPIGEPVLASDSGEVTFAGWDPGYGNLVEITHRDGWKTLYAHNSDIFTWEGQFVRRGDCIALVGETGRATGPHLHWEIRNQSGKPVDPCDHVKL